MELGRVINHEQFRDAIAFPRVLDGWKLPGDIGLGEDRVFEAPHDSQTAWWFEAGIKTRWTTRVFIKSCGNRRSSQRQHGGVVHDYDVGWLANRSSRSCSAYVHHSPVAVFCRCQFLSGSRCKIRNSLTPILTRCPFLNAHSDIGSPCASQWLRATWRSWPYLGTNRRTAYCCVQGERFPPVNVQRAVKYHSKHALNGNSFGSGECTQAQLGSKGKDSPNAFMLHGRDVHASIAQ